MISPNSNVFEINRNIKLFDVQPTNEQIEKLVRIYENIKSITPAKTKLSFKVFLEDGNFRADALITGDSFCVLSRKVSHEMDLLMKWLHADLIRKIVKQRINGPTTEPEFKRKSAV